MNNAGLAVKGTESASSYQMVASEFAQRLKYMLVNGSKLSDQDVHALAQYASATGLDPFAGECWIIPGKGVCPGIAGWRKKAQEQLEYEAREAKEDHGAHYWVEFDVPTTNDCVFEPTKGDIAYHAVLRDSISQHRWRLAVIDSTNEFIKMGADFKEALKEAKALVGAEPVWTAHGVVFNTESFGGLEKMDRKERAQKRAEKLAIKKRFPRIHLPDDKGNDDVAEMGDYSVSIQDISPRSSQENIKALGYGDDENAEKPTGNHVMTYRQACDTTGSGGERYGNLSNEELQGKKIGILRALKNSNLDVSKQSLYENKLMAIDILLGVPEGERLERAGQPTLDVPAEGSGG